MGRLGIVTGLSSEADCFLSLPAAERPRVLCTGARPGYGAKAALQLVNEGCDGLVSFGLAGALDDTLTTGTLVLPDRILCPDGRCFETEARWRKRLAAKLARSGQAVVARPLAASDYPLALPAEKRNLGEDSGGVLVDMESHGVAEVAFEYNLPFLAVRAVADPVTRTVPSWVMGVVEDDGRVDPIRAAFEAMCHPWDIPVLGMLAWESRQGLDALKRVVKASGGRLGLD